MRYLWNIPTRSHGWRRTFIWLKFKSKRPPYDPHVAWNSELDLNHKIFWMGYGPGFQWWCQLQGYGQFACGFAWLSFGLQFTTFDK